MIGKAFITISKIVAILIVALLLSNTISLADISEIYNYQNTLLPASGISSILDDGIEDSFRDIVYFRTLVETMDKILSWPNFQSSEINAIKQVVVNQVPGIDLDVFRVDIMNKSDRGVLFLPYNKKDAEKAYVLRFYHRGVDPDDTSNWSTRGIKHTVIGRIKTGNDKIICEVTDPKSKDRIAAKSMNVKDLLEVSSPVNSEELIPTMERYLKEITGYLVELKKLVELVKKDPMKYGNEMLTNARSVEKICYGCAIPEIRSIVVDNVVNKSVGIFGLLKRDLKKTGTISEGTLAFFPEIEEAIEKCKKEIKEIIFQKRDALNAGGFIEIIEEKALNAFLGGQKIVIAVDESWIPLVQKECMQELLPELQRISSKRGFENIIFVRENGTELAGVLNEVIEKENVNLSDVIILGGVDILRSKKFEDFKIDEDKEEGAFFVEIVMQEHSKGYGYIKLLDLIRFSIRVAFDEDLSTKNPYIDIIHANAEQRFILLAPIPDISVEIDELGKIYDAQARAIARMA
ncbi:MAG: hypothetical protein ABH862_01690 [Candidatus Omnitrophota bacterium]